MSAAGLAPAPFAESLRRAHCAHERAADREHICVGECTITRSGVRLECVPCGNGSELLAPAGAEAEGARSVLEAAGVRWMSLTPEAQRDAVDAYASARARR